MKVFSVRRDKYFIIHSLMLFDDDIGGGNCRELRLSSAPLYLLVCTVPAPVRYARMDLALTSLLLFAPAVATVNAG